MTAHHDHTEELIARALATQGGHLSIGRGGFCLHFAEGSTLSGDDCDAMKARCIAGGLPVIDSRMIAFEDACRLAVTGPMIADEQHPSDTPWTALSYAPLCAVAKSYREAGAEVFNITEVGVAPGMRVAATPS